MVKVSSADRDAIVQADAAVRGARPATETEWIALHDEVHRIADRAPQPWVVLAHVAEALIAKRPPFDDSASQLAMR